MAYWLTPPSRAVFVISLFLAILALLVRYADVAIPVVSNYTFETLLTAFLLLLAGESPQRILTKRVKRPLKSHDFREPATPHSVGR